MGVWWAQEGLDRRAHEDRRTGRASRRQRCLGGAAVGAQFYLGDAVRTADGGAELKLAGTQLIALNPHTVLRFNTGKNNSADIKVELGAIDIVNSSNISLDFGNVKVAPGGKIRITSGTVELVMGKAQLSGANGKLIDLVVGTATDLVIGPSSLADAAVDAAPPDAAVIAPVAGDPTYDISGKKAEIQMPGETKWSALAEGKGTIPKGAKLRLGVNTKAKLVSGATTLDLAGGSRITITDNLVLGMELGAGNASVAAATEGSVGVPGGEVELKGTPTTGAEAHVDVNARGEAKVTMVHGAGKLVGAGPNGATLEVAGGESATLLKPGTINPGVVIPKYFDFKVNAGETPNFTIHDPKGSTALQFNFNGKCPSGGVVEMDHDARFRTPRVSEGKDNANMLAQSGGWAYRLRCNGGNGPGAAVASGRIVVVRDNGRRPLPPKAGKNPIDADGRNYSVSYQSLIPIIEVHYKGTGSDFKLHLATGGAEETFDSNKPVIEIPGKQLKEATYTFWVEHDGIKQEKATTLKIDFDQTAAQVYIEAPLDGAAFAGDVLVSGAALPGWTAKVDAVEIPIIDPNTRRFRATVEPPSGGALALAIRLSHPQRGIHYYIRRGAVAAAPK